MEKMLKVNFAGFECNVRLRKYAGGLMGFSLEEVETGREIIYSEFPAPEYDIGKGGISEGVLVKNFERKYESCPCSECPVKCNNDYENCPYPPEEEEEE